MMPPRETDQEISEAFLRQAYDPWNEEKFKLKANYYRLTNDSTYHYEFRYQLNVSNTSDDHRLVILFNGRGRTCIDYWRFPVGRRIVSTMRASGFSVLAICSQRRTLDVNIPVSANEDVKWIYLSMQRWMTGVYYKTYQRYPRLYIHGISLGTVFAPILARVLPIQAMILTVNPGNPSVLLSPSAYSPELQTRLALEPHFASWFYFDYCYPSKKVRIVNRTLCPFESDLNHFFPIPPTYFIVLEADPWIPVKRYHQLINQMRQNAVNIGTELLNNTQSIQIDILPVINVTASYIQENIDIFRAKPDVAQVFSDYYNYSMRHLTYASDTGTCRCFNINFTYSAEFDEIAQAWPWHMQEAYRQYILYFRNYRAYLCEEVCGDLSAKHAMCSRNLHKALDWITRIDDRRYSLKINDFLKRPIRLWMYPREAMVNGTKRFSSNNIDWTLVSKQYTMYSVESLIQDYFRKFEESHSKIPRHDLRWTEDPLLADYYIVPHDMMYFYFRSPPENLNEEKFNTLRQQLNDEYFGRIFINVRLKYPYWTMAPSSDLIGNNHLITFVGGRDMGYLDAKNQEMVKNVVQLTSTGVRQDLLPPNATIPYSHRTTSIVYRHGYDILLPQFTEVRMNTSALRYWNATFNKKRRLLYFAGSLNHWTTVVSARVHMTTLWSQIMHEKSENRTINLDGRDYQIISIVDGHVKPEEYVEAMHSSVFSMSPEGFLPWSPRLYETIQLGVIPLILADNIVLPFERFVDWRSLSAKINVTHIMNLTSIVSSIEHFESYVKKKLANATPYLHAFQWPYATINQSGVRKHVFVPAEDTGAYDHNIFHFLSRELRCRRLEQFYGFTSNSLSRQSRQAQQYACQTYSLICPCYHPHGTIAFQEYL